MDLSKAYYVVYRVGFKEVRSQQDASTTLVMRLWQVAVG
jgi:hypothetical protein